MKVRARHAPEPVRGELAARILQSSQRGRHGPIGYGPVAGIYATDSRENILPKSPHYPLAVAFLTDRFDLLRKPIKGNGLGSLPGGFNERATDPGDLDLDLVPLLPGFLKGHVRIDAQGSPYLPAIFPNANSPVFSPSWMDLQVKVSVVSGNMGFVMGWESFDLLLCQHRGRLPCQRPYNSPYQTGSYTESYPECPPAGADITRNQPATGMITAINSVFSGICGTDG